VVLPAFHKLVTLVCRKFARWGLKQHHKNTLESKKLLGPAPSSALYFARVMENTASESECSVWGSRWSLRSVESTTVGRRVILQ
jgi:hypothetical protein